MVFNHFYKDINKDNILKKPNISNIVKTSSKAKYFLKAKCLANLFFTLNNLKGKQTLGKFRMCSNKD